VHCQVSSADIFLPWSGDGILMWLKVLF